MWKSTCKYNKWNEQIIKWLRYSTFSSAVRLDRFRRRSWGNSTPHKNGNMQSKSIWSFETAPWFNDRYNHFTIPLYYYVWYKSAHFFSLPCLTTSWFKLLYRNPHDCTVVEPRSNELIISSSERTKLVILG